MTAHRSPRTGPKARFLPGVEALEDRCVPACNFIVSGSTLFIVAPTTPGRVSDRIVISDTGGTGANNVTAFCRAPFFPNVPINNVVVQTGRGDDNVAYNLIGDLTTSRSVTINLGGGNDRFLGTLRRNMLAGSSLALNVNGGAGDDDLETLMIGSLLSGARLSIGMDGGGGNNILTVRSASFVNVAAGASVGVGLIGGGFSDILFSEYSGILGGNYQVLQSGGAGPNNLFADIELAPGSSGQVLQSQLRGGPRNDAFTFLVHNRGTASTNNQLLNGLGGFNTAIRTTNVIALNVQRDNVHV